ncbi:MAG TPA: hypothetical protein VMQ65_05050 [Candidatus Limnocylindria bacterium]|nr:hypothetical protein [Candidatus Limnocylindria bacterium]
MSRFVDRGAMVAAFVGVGMAVTMAIGFLLIIPIEPAYILLSVPGGMVIGYYANARSARVRGQWRRILPNALLAGAVTGLMLGAFVLGTRALFFFGDSGFPDFNRVENGVAVGPTCEPGGDCTYRRYLLAEPEDLLAAGVTDSASFADAYWAQQWSTARLLLVMTTTAALFGGVLFGIAGPRRAAPSPRVATAAA